MKYLNFFVLIFVFFPCKTNGQLSTKKIEIIAIEDAILHPYLYLNELSTISKDTTIAVKLNQEIQKLSVNTLSSRNPIERLKEKKELLKVCIRNSSLECEKYVPEVFKILVNKNRTICVEYSYSTLGSKDEWFKYACFDLKALERLTYDKVFNEPKVFLAELNKRYVSDFQKQLQEYTEEDYEYEMIRDHLNDRESFTLEDLNNFEIVYTDNSDEVASIRFHYNGLGGVYSSVLSRGFIAYKMANIAKKINQRIFKK